METMQPQHLFPSPLWGGVATPDLIGGSRGGVVEQWHAA
jgi:hypothetical protein